MNIFKLINLFENIPGISKKLAQKLALKIIDNDEVKSDLELIINEANKFKYCNICGLIFMKENNCINCGKNTEKLYVFENQLNLLSIESKTNLEGEKFVIGFESKKDFLDFDKVSHMIERINIFVKNKQIKEMIFMLSPSIETEIIIKVITEKLANSFNNIVYSKLSAGVPFGGSVEHSDEITIRKAVEKREKF